MSTKKASEPRCVGANENGTDDVTWHANACTGSDFGTLCGLSLDGDAFLRVEAKPGRKITCEQCLQVWLEARRFVRKDFA